ncbi:MAG: PQQ-binding-like beta-propeller repeat protein [Planctomycetaceae bacterium]|nr:PQQ-binding-like beta-propeller repeat protein [Planctomycetaceae bacterium]
MPSAPQHIHLLAALVIATTTPGDCSAENWPGWRGPRGDGTSHETSVPVSWDATTGENIAWKVPVPGLGHASPVVWNDRIFLATCLTDDQDRQLLSFDRRDGKLLWQKSVVVAELEKKHNLNSYASGTPATDGNHVYVTFLVLDPADEPDDKAEKPKPRTSGQMLVAAYDFEGNQLWTAFPGAFSSTHGFCSSPVIFEDLLIINGDHDGDSYVTALDRSTGKEVWKVPREHKTRSYCTPLIRMIDGQQQLVMSGSKQIVSLDPRTGKQIWHIEGPTEQFVASMVFDGRQFFMSAGFPTHHVMCIRPTGQGNVTESHVTWHSTQAKCYVPSPVVVGHRLFVADDRGTANCFDTRTGDRIWQDRMGMHYSASLVTANDLIYFLADDGITKVVRPADKLEVVSQNPLGEYAYASPAISQGHIYIRGEHHLFAIGPNEGAP